jgi:hypothetical protein
MNMEIPSYARYTWQSSSGTIAGDALVTEIHIEIEDLIGGSLLLASEIYSNCGSLLSGGIARCHFWTERDEELSTRTVWLMTQRTGGKDFSSTE